MIWLVGAIWGSCTAQAGEGVLQLNPYVSEARTWELVHVR